MYSYGLKLPSGSEPLKALIVTHVQAFQLLSVIFLYVFYTYL